MKLKRISAQCRKQYNLKLINLKIQLKKSLIHMYKRLTQEPLRLKLKLSLLMKLTNKLQHIIVRNPLNHQISLLRNLVHCLERLKKKEQKSQGQKRQRRKKNKRSKKMRKRGLKMSKKRKKLQKNKNNSQLFLIKIIMLIH